MMKSLTIPYLVSFVLFLLSHFSFGDFLEAELDNIAKSGKKVRIFTDEEMRSYDGTDETKPIYMGVKGFVFDVSSGKRFYGKGSSYNILVGKDSTRAVAKMSLSEDDMTHDVSSLSESQLQSLEEVFEGTYMAKYPVAGFMDYMVDLYPDKLDKIRMKAEL